MLSQKSTMKTKLENMYLQKRISYGYRKVINMMLLSGVISIIAIGILFANMMNYVNNVNAADQAVKTCRININTAARNVREMALNDDESTYDSYEEKVKELLGIDVGECTPDGKFSIDATRCIGACGLAPVLTVNDEVYGRLTVDDIEDIINKYR